MKFLTMLLLMVMYVTFIMGGVVKRHAQKHQEEHEVEQDDEYNAHAGLDFFQKFQSLFGWGDETTTTTSPLPRQAQPVLVKVPSHRHQQQAVEEIPTPTVAPVQYPAVQYPPPPPHSQYPRRPQATIGQYYNYPQNVRYPPPPQYPYRYPSPYQARPYYHPYPQAQAQYPQTTPVISTNSPILQHTTPTNLLKAETQVEKEALGDVALPNKNKAIPNKNNAIPNKSKAIPNKKALRNPVHQPIVLSESALPESVLPPEDCHTREGDIGVCVSAGKCGETNGYPSGLCHMGQDVSLHLRVCCIYPAFCGFKSNHRVTYFKSPSYPATTIKLSSCPYTVNLLPGVCQVRLDFLDFQMKPLLHGECDTNNILSIKSSYQPTYIPVTELCGNIANGDLDPLRTDVPHMYVHYDMDPVYSKEESLLALPNKGKADFTPSLQLHFNVSNFASKWNIRVSQIDCDGANLQAPAGCSQYYNSNSGNITSLNLNDREYMTKTSIDACIARDPTACAIKYKLSTLSVGPTKGGGLGYGLVCTDYIKFQGEKTGICGNGTGREMVLPVRGPMGLTFRSDGSHIPQADVGYVVEYAYMHNCTGLEFFKYPASKL